MRTLSREKKEYNARKRRARRIQNSPSEAFLKKQKELEEEREESQKRALQRLIDQHHKYEWSYQTQL